MQTLCYGITCISDLLRKNKITKREALSARDWDKTKLKALNEVKFNREWNDEAMPSYDDQNKWQR